MSPGRRTFTVVVGAALAALDAEGLGKTTFADGSAVRAVEVAACGGRGAVGAGCVATGGGRTADEVAEGAGAELEVLAEAAGVCSTADAVAVCAGVRGAGRESGPEATLRSASRLRVASAAMAATSASAIGARDRAGRGSGTVTAAREPA